MSKEKKTQIVLRVSANVREQLKAAADSNKRSLTKETEFRLEQMFAGAPQ